MKYKSTVVGLFILLIVISLLFLKKTCSSPQSDQFVVGTAAGYAPFVSINHKGEYEGFDIDVAHALAKQLGKKLVIKDLGSMTSLFTALDQESIDVIMWGLSITQDRLKKVAMIHYQGDVTISYPLIFWNKIPEGMNSIDAMIDKIVCVEPTSSQDAVLSKYPFIKTLAFEKVDDALLAIQYGKADAAFVEPAIAKKFKKKYPEIKILDVPLLLNDQVNGVGIVIKKNKKELIKNVHEAVERLKISGVISQFEQKWDILS